MSRVPRVATINEAPAIAELVNAAFLVENFFKRGDRTDVGSVRERFAAGEFLVLDSGDEPSSGLQLAACVYLERDNARAYFGMLAIAPARQGQGLGRLMIDTIETRCRESGCQTVEIHVVNLREELPPFYRRFGYVETGTLPFPDDGSASRPCHFIVMEKRLG